MSEADISLRTESQEVETKSVNTTSGNFTIQSGLVQLIDERSWDRIWKPLIGRRGSTVFIFDSISKRLIYELGPKDHVPIMNRIKDQILGIHYEAVAASNQFKTFNFISDFMCGDTKIPNMTLEMRISTNDGAQVAMAVEENEDPLKELCNLVKSGLDVVLSDIKMDNLDNLKAFMDRIHDSVRKFKVHHPYLRIENLIAEFTLPDSIETAFNAMAFKAESERELQEAERIRNIEKIKKTTDLELDELELDRLGITDARFRLLMRDPEKRAQYLEDLYQHQLGRLKHSNDQEQQLINMRLETIKQYQNQVLDEHSDVEELKNLLGLINQTANSNSANQDVLGPVFGNPQLIKVDTDNYPRLEDLGDEDVSEDNISSLPIEDSNSKANEADSENPVDNPRKKRRKRFNDSDNQISAD